MTTPDPSADPAPNDSAAPPGVSPAPSAYAVAPGYGQPGFAPAPPGYAAPPGYGAPGASPYGYATPPAAPQGKPPAKAWDIAVTITLLVVDLGLAAVASIMAMFLIMASDPCGVRSCSNDLITLGWLIGMLMPWVVLIVTVVVAIVRLVRRRLAFWVPLVGAVAIALSLVIAFMVTAAGVPSG